MVLFFLGAVAGRSAGGARVGGPARQMFVIGVRVVSRDLEGLATVNINPPQPKLYRAALCLWSRAAQQRSGAGDYRTLLK